MQASGGQSLQLASCAHGRGLPCLPTVSYSLRSAGSQLALRNPGQQAGLGFFLTEACGRLGKALSELITCKPRVGRVFS